MMSNSYEFEQPLDLRLKALNLSLGAYEHRISGQHGCSPSNTSASTTTSSASAASISLLGSSQTGAHQLPANSARQPHYSNPTICSAHAFAHLQQRQSGAQLHQQPFSPHLPGPIQPAGPQAPQAQAGPQPASPGAASQARPANIHCQPLNHHQPHPLAGRLHPASQLNQAQSRSPEQNNQPTNLHTRLNMGSPAPSSLAVFESNPTGLAQASVGPLYQPSLPIKSLSVSSHHHSQLLSSSLPTGFGLRAASASASASACSPMPQLAHQIAGQNFGLQSSQRHQQSQSMHSDPSTHQQLGFTPSTNQQVASNDFTVSPPANELSTSSSSLSSPPAFMQQKQQTQQQQQPQNTSPASPITRQQSLVSRYNCKPCGIVFSQPETLRAHQEGYCTKRDRNQAVQVRIRARDRDRTQ